MNGLHKSNSNMVSVFWNIWFFAVDKDSTRVTAYSATLIDHIYSNQLEKITECFTPKLVLSDHYPVCFTRQTSNLQTKKRNHISIKYRLLTNFENSAFWTILAKKLKILNAPRLIQIWFFQHGMRCSCLFSINMHRLTKNALSDPIKTDFMTPSEQLFKKLNWLPFPKRVQYHTCFTVYRSITGQAPEYISSLLTYVSAHHERQNRSTTLDLLHIPRSHSATFDRAFSVQCPKLWNSLPADIRNSKSINRFKSEPKRCLLYNNWNPWKLCRIRDCSSANVGCGGLGFFGRRLDRPWLSPPSTAGDTSGFTSAKLCCLLQRYRFEVL